MKDIRSFFNSSGPADSDSGRPHHAPHQKQHSIAIPLLSVEDFGFTPEASARAAQEALAAFLTQDCGHSDLRVVMVAPDRCSAAYAALERELKPLADTHAGVVIAVGDVSKVDEICGPCKFMVNPCNWRFAAAGGRTNAAVNQAAGPCLSDLSKQLYGTAKVATPHAVQLPEGSPLFAGGVRTVLQVLGPNINPQRPDCMTDQEEAQRLLRQAYRAALDFFRDAVNGSAGSPPSPARKRPRSPSPDAREGAAPTASPGSPSPKAARVQPACGGGGAGSAAEDDQPGGPPGGAPSFPQYKHPGPVVTRDPDWRNSLYKYIRKPVPPDLQDKIFYEDEDCVVVYDAYPKARQHLLLLPRPQFLSSAKGPDALRGADLPKLRKLHALARQIEKHLEASAGVPVRSGYHALPSMTPLHLHIISQDFDSPCLKNKKHWNTFTTEFFLGMDWVEHRLASTPLASLNKKRYQDLEKGAMRCHRCGSHLHDMKALKMHYPACLRRASTGGQG